jgi:hypothetical protein
VPHRTASAHTSWQSFLVWHRPRVPGYAEHSPSSSSQGRSRLPVLRRSAHRCAILKHSKATGAAVRRRRGIFVANPNPSSRLRACACFVHTRGHEEKGTPAAVPFAVACRLLRRKSSAIAQPFVRADVPRSTGARRSTQTFGNAEYIRGYASVFALPSRECREVVAGHPWRVWVFVAGPPPPHCAVRLGLSVLRRPAHPWLPVKRHRPGTLPQWRGVAPGLFVLRGVGATPAPRCTLQRGLSVLRRPAHRWLPLGRHRPGPLTQSRCVAPGLFASKVAACLPFCRVRTGRTLRSRRTAFGSRLNSNVRLRTQ